MSVISLTDKNREYYNRNKDTINAQRKARKNATVRGRMLALIGNSRARAKREGWDYDLTVDFLCALWEEQEGKCAITGEELTLQTEKVRWSGTLVSLDRIDSTKHYTQDNVWLVSIKVNYAKGVQSYDDFVDMCRKVVENYRA